MPIIYLTYPFINAETGKPPVTGDEFLYVWAHGPTPPRLCMKKPIHPIKKHPRGLYFGYLCFWVISAIIFLVTF